MKKEGGRHLNPTDWRLVRTEAGRKIFLSFFEDWANTVDVSKKCYPGAYKNELKPKRGNIPIVWEYFDKFRSLGYLDGPEKRKKERYYRKTKRFMTVDCWRANLKPFFEWAEEERKVIFDEKEKKVLTSFFELDKIRQVMLKQNRGNDLFQTISVFLLRFALMPRMDSPALSSELEMYLLDRAPFPRWKDLPPSPHFDWPDTQFMKEPKFTSAIRLRFFISEIFNALNLDLDKSYPELKGKLRRLLFLPEIEIVQDIFPETPNKTASLINSGGSNNQKEAYA